MYHNAGISITIRTLSNITRIKGESLIMKKMTLMLITGLTIALAACGGVSEQPQEPEPAEITADEPEPEEPEVPSEDESDTDIPSEESLIADFKEAQNLWFKFEGGLETDYSDSVNAQVNGYDMEYFRVTEPGIGTLDELAEYLSARVDKDFVENAVYNNDQYMESDGALYSCPAGRGDDLSIGWVEFAAETDGKSGKVIVTIHRQDYYDLLGDFYESGEIDTYEYPFSIEDGHAIFDFMEYNCGSCPYEAPVEGYDSESLEAALLGLLEGRWIYDDGSAYYDITADGSFTYYIDGEAVNTGYITSSLSDDATYMMNGDDISGTFFTYDRDQSGVPVILFDNRSTVFTMEGKG